jgi:hypothetical protein
VVREVAIDANGDKWIATQRAVQKYDGSTWTTYTTANGLDYDAIGCLAVRNGVVWVGTNKGLSRFDGSSWTNINDPAKLSVGRFGASDLTINDIVVAQNGTVWLAGSRGLARFDGSTWVKFNSSNSGLQEEAVTALSLDEARNMLWIGTNCNSSQSGVYGLNTQTLAWRYNNLGGNSCVHGVAASPNGAVFVGTCNRSGLLVFANGIVSRFTDASCVALDGVRVDPTNPQRVWVATESFGTGPTPRGLLVYDGSTIVQEFNRNNSGLPSSLLSGLALEPVGSRLRAWVGTADQGLAVYESVVTAQRTAQPNVAVQARPNPAADAVEIRCELSRYTLAVYDNTGRLLHHAEVSQAGPLRLPVQSWPQGLYHVRLSSAQGSGFVSFSKG